MVDYSNTEKAQVIVSEQPSNNTSTKPLGPGTRIPSHIGVKAGDFTEWFDFTAQALKEAFIEMCEMYYGEHLWAESSPEPSFHLFDFDASILEEGETTYLGSSLESVLEKTLQHKKRLFVLSMIHSHWRNSKDPRMQTIRDEINELLDLELKDRGVAVEHKWNDFARAIKVAEVRVGCNTKSPQKIKEYQVQLSLLANGNAVGWRVDKPLLKLWIQDSQPLHYLLEILRQESSVCNKSVVGGKVTSVGYTLEDGPWMYRMTRDGQAFGTWFELKDEHTFNVMLDKLTTNERVCTMMHSLEKSAATESQRANRNEMHSEEQGLKERGEYLDGLAQEILDENGKPFFDRGSYLDFILEDLDAET